MPCDLGCSAKRASSQVCSHWRPWTIVPGGTAAGAQAGQKASAVPSVMHPLAQALCVFEKPGVRGHSARQRRQSCCMNFETVSPAGLSIVRRLRACGGFRTEPWRMPAFLANTSVSMPVAPASIIEITEVAAPDPAFIGRSCISTRLGRRWHHHVMFPACRLNRSAGWSRARKRIYPRMMR